jgi:DNA-binding CsgD family transcriptional regulator
MDTHYQLGHLESAVKQFCSDRRAYVTKPKSPSIRGSAETLYNILLEELPDLAEHLFGRVPSTTNVERIINFAVDGIVDGDTPLNSDIPSAWQAIWKYYYRQGQTQRFVSDIALITEPTLSRKIKIFHRRVAIQLWERQLELSRPITISALTKDGRRSLLCFEIWALSESEAKLALTYYKYPEMKQKEIANLLGKSIGGVKSQTRAIIKKMSRDGVKNTSDIRLLLHRVFREKNLD